MGVLPEQCAHRAAFRVLFVPQIHTPESELPWLVPGLPVYYHRSTGERVPATIVGRCPKGGHRISIPYKLGGQEVLYGYTQQEQLEFAIATPSSPSRAESPEPPQLQHDEALMDTLVEPPWNGC